MNTMLNEGYTLFITENDFSVNDENITHDYHVFIGQTDTFSMESGEYYKIDFDQKWIQRLHDCHKINIVDWKSLDGNKIVTLQESLSDKNHMTFESVLTKYSHLIGKTWEEMKGNEEYVTFRKLVVDALLEKIIKDLDCVESCIFKSVGSVTPYSDYDVSVSGRYATEIVERFNQIFRKTFGNESAIIFDTNIYGASFVEESWSNNFHIFTKLEDNKKYKYVSDSGKEDVISQRKWALIKLYENLSSSEKLQLGDKFKMIQKRFLYLKSIVSDRDDIQKMNETYVKMLKRFKQYKEKMLYEKVSQNDREKLQSLKMHYKDSLSLANYFGNEMYYTQGAFMHVVANIQSKIGIPLTKNEYMDSFIENMGDLFKTLNDSQVFGDDSVCPKLLAKVSKYFSRASNVLVKLGYLHEETTYNASETLRKKVRNKKQSVDCNETGDECILPKTAKQLNMEFMKSLGITDCNGLREIMMTYLVKYLRTDIL